MSKPIAHAPVEYTENEELGELRVIPDFLPSPQALAERAKKGSRRKITITLENDSLAFFKKIAQDNHVSYQKMIRTLLDDYVRQHRQA